MKRAYLEALRRVGLSSKHLFRLDRPGAHGFRVRIGNGEGSTRWFSDSVRGTPILALFAAARWAMRRRMELGIPESERNVIIHPKPKRRRARVGVHYRKDGKRWVFEPNKDQRKSGCVPGSFRVGVLGDAQARYMAEKAADYADIQTYGFVRGLRDRDTVPG